MFGWRGRHDGPGDGTTDPDATHPADLVQPITATYPAWRDLGPTATVAPIQRVVPLDPFVASLATSANPSFLGPLGHLVDPSAPSGEIAGLTAAGSPRTVPTGPALAPPLPADRHSAGPMERAVQRISALPRLLFGEVAQPAPLPEPDVARGSGEPARFPVQRDHSWDPADAHAGDAYAPEPVDAVHYAEHFAAEPRSVPVTASAESYPALLSEGSPRELPVLPLTAPAADRPAVGESSSAPPAAVQRAAVEGAAVEGAAVHRAEVQGAEVQRAEVQGAEVQGAEVQRAAVVSEDAPLLGQLDAPLPLPAVAQPVSRESSTGFQVAHTPRTPGSQVQRSVEAPSAPTSSAIPGHVDSIGIRDGHLPDFDSVAMMPTLSSESAPVADQRVAEVTVADSGPTSVTAQALSADVDTPSLDENTRAPSTEPDSVEVGLLGERAPLVAEPVSRGADTANSAPAVPITPLLGATPITQSLPVTAADTPTVARWADDRTGGVSQLPAFAPESHPAPAALQRSASAGLGAPGSGAGSGAGAAPSPVAGPGAGPVTAEVPVMRTADLTAPTVDDGPGVSVGTAPLLGAGTPLISADEPLAGVHEPLAIASDHIPHAPATAVQRDTLGLAVHGETAGPAVQRQLPSLTAQRETPSVAGQRETPHLTLQRDAPTLAGQPQTPILASQHGTPHAVQRDTANSTIGAGQPSVGLHQLFRMMNDEPPAEPSHEQPESPHAVAPTPVAPLLGDSAPSPTSGQPSSLQRSTPTDTAPLTFRSEASTPSWPHPQPHSGVADRLDRSAQPWTVGGPIVQRTLAGSNGSAPVLRRLTASAPTTTGSTSGTPSNPSWSSSWSSAPDASAEPAAESVAGISTVRSMPLQRMFDHHSPAAVADHQDPPSTDHHDSVRAQIQRLVELNAAQAENSHGAESAGTVAQREVAPTLAPSPEPAVVTVQAAAGPPPVVGGGAALPTNLDELVRRLFDPLSARLKAELWLDRERAGSALDLYP